MYADVRKKLLKEEYANVKRCRCSSEGCTCNGAKIALKVCSRDGCKNYTQKEGVCRRLGTKRLRSLAAAMDAQIKPSVEERHHGRGKGRG